MAVLIVTAYCCTAISAETKQPSREAITVNYPPDNTVMEFDLLAISLTVPPGSADLVKVIVNRDEKLKIVPDSEYECFSTQLTPGNNIIHIVSIREGRIVDEIFMNVFRRSDLERSYVNPPDGFKKDRFHSADRQECSGCHTLVPAATDKKPMSLSAVPSEKLRGAYDEAAANSTCYSCHKTLLSYPFVHGPAAVWSCLSCHDPEATPKYAVKKPDTKACFSCHQEQKEQWYTKKFLHGPFNTGNCHICHNPHASENNFVLIKSTWDLCVSCHIDKGSGRHIVQKLFRLNYHPTRGKRDPSSPGKELTCSSCHDSHGSDVPKIQRFSYSNLFVLCQKCHANQGNPYQDK